MLLGREKNAKNKKIIFLASVAGPGVGLFNVLYFISYMKIPHCKVKPKLFYKEQQKVNDKVTVILVPVRMVSFITP